MSPRGNARAAYFCRGVALPPRGSVGERVMFEMLKRERWNKLAEFDLTLRSVASFLGVSREGADNLIGVVKKSLDSRLSHEYYDARVILSQLQEKLAGLYKNRQLMYRLESMGT